MSDEGAVTGGVVRTRCGHKDEATVNARWSDAPTTPLFFGPILCLTKTAGILWRVGKGAMSGGPTVSSALYKRVENITGSGGAGVVITSGIVCAKPGTEMVDAT